MKKDHRTMVSLIRSEYKTVIPAQPGYFVASYKGPVEPDNKVGEFELHPIVAWEIWEHKAPYDKQPHMEPEPVAIGWNKTFNDVWVIKCPDGLYSNTYDYGGWIDEHGALEGCQDEYQYRQKKEYEEDRNRAVAKPQGHVTSIRERLSRRKELAD